MIEQKGYLGSHIQAESKNVVILLPGLCGSELELGALPRLLKQSGISYLIPEIPGYTAHSGLESYTQWIETIEEIILDLERNGKSVSLVGISMGATLAMSVAERHQSITCLCLLSPTIYFDGWSIPWYHSLLWILYRIGIRNWHYKEVEPYGVKNAALRKHIRNAVKANAVSELGAAHIPAKHIYQSQLLINSTVKNLKDIEADTLIIHSIDDETASPRNVETIIRGISSVTKKTIWLGNSYHMITVDNDREIVTNSVVSFIVQSTQKKSLSDELSLNTPSLIIKNRTE